jgi:asparagine synthase (glutamine-hydrolysing)
MCGLAGIYHPNGGPVDRPLLERMTTALFHRGPDGDGFHVEPGVGLGHRRLSIIDVAGGHQPMFNEDESVVIVFNGEIYNFPELRPKLQALGHVFRNRCDTEAIIHAWESWGPECLHHLNGQFAFALWDRNQQTLFLARDRMGEKPLYYARRADGSLVFGSEMTALAQVRDLPRQISAEAVDDFFAMGYVPDPHTIYEGIHKLPAAHYLMLRAGSHAAPRRYWSAPTAVRPMDEVDALPALRAGLSAATQQCLLADVPLGAFLSGGVDSSGVVATAAGLLSEPLKTFTIGFPGVEDESPLAALVAARYGTAQHVERAEAPDYLDAVRRQARIFGEPFGDSSSVPTESVCALARRQVTVALSGDGGDEVFAGYRRYRWHQMAEAVRAYVPAPLRRGVLGQLAAAYPKMDWAPRWLRAKHTLTEISLDSALGYYRTVAKVHHDQRRRLFSAPLRAQLDGHDPAARIVDLMQACDSDDTLLQAQFVDINTYLVGDILTKVDRTSMAHSLEVRAPFLDHRLVEWGMSLPPSLKLRGQEGKYLLKRALEPLVPSEILYRRKQGFAMSLTGLFRAEAARLRSRLLSGKMADCGLFDGAAIEQLITQHEQGRSDHATPLWLLLAFEGFLEAEAALQVPVARAA